MEFSGKTVLVTGAAGAVGQAVARAFGARGARLVLADVSKTALLEAFGNNRLAHSGPEPMLLVVDLLNQQDLSAQLKLAAQIDVLCNIAGGFTMGPAVHETDDKVWRSMLDINLSTVLATARAVVPGMLQRGSGWIVNVGAGAALRGGAGMGAYAAAKSAVLRVTESMSAELRERGIHVNCVLPSIIDTPQNRRDMPDADPARWVSTAALADVITFLSSPAADAIHGACIPVNGLS